MMLEDLPGGDRLYDTAGALIQAAVREINLGAGTTFAASLRVNAVNIEVGGLIADLISNLTGADPGSLVDPTLSLDERVQALVEFKEKLQSWLGDYADALASLRSEDDCTRWGGISVGGEKVLDVLPFFK